MMGAPLPLHTGTPALREFVSPKAAKEVLFASFLPGSVHLKKKAGVSEFTLLERASMKTTVQLHRTMTQTFFV